MLIGKAKIGNRPSMIWTDLKQLRSFEADALILNGRIEQVAMDQSL
jgi:hypothetical protein